MCTELDLDRAEMHVDRKCKRQLILWSIHLLTKAWWFDPPYLFSNHLVLVEECVRLVTWAKLLTRTIEFSDFGLQAWPEEMMQDVVVGVPYSWMTRTGKEAPGTSIREQFHSKSPTAGGSSCASKCHPQLSNCVSLNGNYWTIQWLMPDVAKLLLLEH